MDEEKKLHTNCTYNSLKHLSPKSFSEDENVGRDMRNNWTEANSNYKVPIEGIPLLLLSLKIISETISVTYYTCTYYIIRLSASFLI